MEESYDMLYEMASVGYFTTCKKNGKQESPKFKVFICGDLDTPQLTIQRGIEMRWLTMQRMRK